MAIGSNINQTNFDQEVTNSDKPVLIDFWAPNCRPCKMMEPVLDSVSKKLGENVKMGAVNIEENRDLAIKFGIRSIPTLLFFEKDRVIAQVVGKVSEEDIISKVSQLF